VVAHALVTDLILPFTAPRVILSDNGAEFNNAVLVAICTMFKIKQCFTASYHPSSNGLVERANRKILESLRHCIRGLDHSWEDWIQFVSASINGLICSSTGKTPHQVIFGMEKRLPYELLTQPRNPCYNMDDYAQRQKWVFQKIYVDVKTNPAASTLRQTETHNRKAKTPRFEV
ncbi:MAG: transposase family protein, partial [Gammaproteobacteria bacterium]|nr:transposase family protein [Gammaproteobacteria bacterium]